MDKKQIIVKTADYVRKELEGEGSGHEWWHIYRVWKNAINIGKNEKIDMLVVELAALLHDISDWKLNCGYEDKGPKIAEEWLSKIEVEAKIIDQVKTIIKTLSFKGAGEISKMQTIEGKVVQDADRLDAIGAVGIARVFSYGGYMNRIIYDPDLKPIDNMTADKYKNNKGTSINHFYEKLLLLKNLMNTESAKRIAENRHEYMKKYLEEFYEEWEGKK